MFGFKKKDEKTKIIEEREKLLEKYIKECRKAGFLDETILKRLREINVSWEFLNKHFETTLIKEVLNSKLNQQQEVNQMPKSAKEKEYEEDEEIEESDEEEQEEDEEIEESDEEERPKKKELKVKEVKKEEETQVTIAQVLQNHEERIRNIEASLFKLRTI